jgi:cell division protein FtsB
MTVFFVVIILAVVVGMSVKNVLELSYEQHQLKMENASLKEKKAALEREFENINDKNYIEEQARKQLNMVKPGEIVYIIEEEDKKKN